MACQSRSNIITIYYISHIHILYYYFSVSRIRVRLLIINIYWSNRSTAEIIVLVESVISNFDWI